MQVMYLGRAPLTKESLPDFLKWCRVTRHLLVFSGLTGSQWTPRNGVSQILPSKVEYLFALLYNSSIVVGGSNENEWKNGVDDAKLFLKFWRTVYMLETSTYWTACLNLLVKSHMDSSSCLMMVCKELMFLVCCTEQRYRETNRVQSSLNEFIELCESLWNQASAGPWRLAEKTLHSRWLFMTFRVLPGYNEAFGHNDRWSRRT